MIAQKIVLVNFSHTWGGGENWHYITARELDKRGYNVELLVRNGSELFRHCKKTGVPCMPIRIGNHAHLNPFSNRKIKRYLRENEIDTLILNGSVELKLVARQASAIGVRKIIYRRGIPLPIKSSAINRRLFRECVTDVIANSQITKNAIEEIVSSAEIPITVIPNGVNTEDLQVPSEAPGHQVVILSRLAKEKGLHLAIRAMKLVINEVPDAILIIAGDGSFRSHLESEITRLNLSAHVKLVGFVEDTRSILSNSSVLLMPSVWEGFGFSLLEGMLNSLPCIAFRKTSAEEIIDDGITGILVPHRDVKALASATIKLLEDRELRKKMGRAGLKRVKANYSIGAVTDLLLETIGDMRQAKTISTES